MQSEQAVKGLFSGSPKYAGLLESAICSANGPTLIVSSSANEGGREVSELVLRDFLSLERDVSGEWGRIIVDLTGSEVPEAGEEQFFATATVELVERGSLILLCDQTSKDCARIAGLARSYFGMVVPVRLIEEGIVLCGSFEGAEAICMREPLAKFRGIDVLETRSYRTFVSGQIEEAWRLLCKAGRKRGESYHAVRYWNHLTLDRRERMRPGKSNAVTRVIGSWDLRFVPHALGEFLYFMAALDYVAAEQGVETIEIWCLAPGSDEVRFDQSQLDDDVRETRVVQFRELSEFSPCGISGYKVFSEPADYDAALADAMSDSIVVPRHESKCGGMYASYLHNYRFLSSAYFATKRPPHLFPSESYLEGARSRVAAVRRDSGRQRVVVTHLRYSKLDAVRNVEIEEWVDLFRVAERRYPDLLFYLLGEGELKERLDEEGLGENLRFAGEEKRGVMSDFSLIHAADGFLGGPSGPAIVPLLSPVPYLFYKYKLVNELPYLLPPNPFPWAVEGQRIHWLEHDEKGLLEVFGEWVEAMNWK